MKNLKVLGIAFIILFGFISSQRSKSVIKPNSLKLIWSTEIGSLSYRSNIAINGNALFIGSNGSHFNDAFALDETNGVYKLNTKSGKVVKRFGNELFGDMDVNGVLKFENNIIFGNDNDELLAFDTNGNKKWRIPTGGDVEHEPILIQNGDQKIVVFATENGQISGINPANGEAIWTYYHKKFEGWKPGDNRRIFKVKTHFLSSNIFFDKPLVVDVNSDGVKDLIYSNYHDITCINPINGKRIWERKTEENKNEYVLRRSPLNLSISKNKIRFHYVIRNYEQKKSRLITLNKYGKKIDEKEIQIEDISNNSLTNYLIDQNGIYDIITGKFHPLEVSKSYTHSCSEKLFIYKNEPCIAVVSDAYFDYRKGVEYVSNIKIIGLKTFKIHLSKGLEENTESVPLIADINHDGKLNLLVGCYNQKIYCYDLDIPSSNLID